MKIRLVLVCGLSMLFAFSHAEAQQKVRVGVMPFKNASGKPQDMWLGDGFAESLTEGLLQIQSLNVIPQKDVSSVIKQLKITPDEIFKKEDEAKFKVGESLGLDFMVIGAFRAKKTTIDAIALLVDVKKKALIAECSSQGAKKKAFIWDLFDELIDGVTKASCFNVSVSANEKIKIKEVTKNTEALDAYEYYIKGRKEHLKFSVKAFENAVGWYRKAIAVDDHYSLAMGAMAEALAFWGYQKELNGEAYKDMYANAFDLASKAIEYRPSIASLHRNIATVYQMKRQFDDAKASASKATELNPNDAEAYYMLWAATGKNIDDPNINKCLDINPYLGAANVDLGLQYYRKEDYENAEKYFLRALKVNEDYELAHINLGFVYIKQKKYDEAEHHVRRTIAIKPEYALAWNRLGYIFGSRGYDSADKGDTEKALAYHKESIPFYEKAVEINPKSGYNYNDLGYGYRNIGAFEKAIKAWETALQLKPDFKYTQQEIDKAREKLAK